MLASTLGGLLANPADAPNSYPVALPGFYSLNVTYVTTFKPDGSVLNATVIVDASSACPPVIAAQYPGRDTCIVGCRPAGACLGGNVCAPGYQSVAPYFGCGACAPQYYSRDGSCVACPSSPGGPLVGLLVLLLVLGGVGYVLNSKGIMIGYISMAIDNFQVGGRPVPAATQTDALRATRTLFLTPSRSPSPPLPRSSPSWPPRRPRGPRPWRRCCTCCPR